MAKQLKFGFPVYLGYYYFVSDRFFVLGTSGMKVLGALSAVHAAIPDTPNPYWLLRFRKDIAWICRREPKALLAYVADRTLDRDLRILAIWLRGRCGGYLGTETLAKFAYDADDRIRKEVVRALVRMKAWSKLTRIATGDTNLRIRRLASSRVKSEYATRLATFAHHVSEETPATGKQEFYVSPELEIALSKPAKSIEFIRAILERIRSLVQSRWRMT